MQADNSQEELLYCEISQAYSRGPAYAAELQYLQKSVVAKLAESRPQADERS